MDPTHSLTNPETLILLNDKNTLDVVHKGKVLNTFEYPMDAITWTIENAEKYGIKSFQMATELVVSPNEDEDRNN